jgi:hypothetical protein
VLPIFGEGTDLIEGLPADSFAALVQPNLGKPIDYYVDLSRARRAAATRSSSRSGAPAGSTSSAT